MLNAVQNYRGSALHANIFTALRSFMQVQPEPNPILFKVFYKSCARYDSKLSTRLATILFPNLDLSSMVPATIPKDIAKLFPQPPNCAVTLASFIRSAPRERQYFVRAALFEWNRLLQGMEKASPELLERINTTVDPKICETLLSRLRTAEAVQNYLAIEKQYNVKDAWILFNLLEYLRHMMALQWPTATKQGAVDTLERLWMVFMANTYKHLLHSITPLNTTATKNDQ